MLTARSYQRIMGNSRHAHSNSVIGWGVWIAVIVFIWALAFVRRAAAAASADVDFRSLARSFRPLATSCLSSPPRSTHSSVCRSAARDRS